MKMHQRGRRELHLIHIDGDWKIDGKQLVDGKKLHLLSQRREGMMDAWMHVTIRRDDSRWFLEWDSADPSKPSMKIELKEGMIFRERE